MGKAFTIETMEKQALGIVIGLLVTPGEIKIGHDDIKAIMGQHGPALICTGSGTGDDRLLKACHDALTNLWKETGARGAAKVLLNINGSSNLLLKDVNCAIDMVKETVAASTEITFGVTINDKYDDEITVILLAGGIFPQ